MPLSDGGEGLLEVLRAPLSLQQVQGDSVDAGGSELKAEIGVAGERAFVESAQTCGVGPRRPWTNSSYGLGLLAKQALSLGVRELNIGLGGTLVIDGGLGFLSALGAKVDFVAGKGGGGLEGLERVQRISLGPALAALRGVKLVALCDVDSPLLGAHGARLYMEQKGLAAAALGRAERILARWSQLLGGAPSTAGAGAAGGLGLAIAALGGRLVSGADYVLDLVKADERIAGSAGVIGGEGRVDSQSLCNKITGALVRRAQRQSRPVALVAGQVEPGMERALGVPVFGLNSIADASALGALAAKLARTESDLQSLAAGALGAWVMNGRRR